MRVVTWNVLADGYVRRAHFPRTPPAVFDKVVRRRRVVERLASFSGADVICLQEADRALFAAAKESLSWAFSHHLCKPGRDEGCATFVRKELADSAIWRELVFGDPSGHVALGVSLREVTLVNTHLKWEPDDTPAAAHRGRAQLGEILSTWPAGTRIVCGDLNAEPSSVVLALAKEHGLRDAYASMPDAFSCNANARKKRIDFILHSPELRATPQPIPAIEDETPLPSDAEPSDHLAIAASLDA